jgi:hypothetical protein
VADSRGQLGHGADHEMSAGRCQSLRVTRRTVRAAREADDTHPGIAPRRHSAGRILNDKRLLRSPSHAPGRVKKDVRGGLWPLDLNGAEDAALEQRRKAGNA